MKKILFIVGSLRKDSFNRHLAKEAEKMIGDRAEVSYLDYSDVPLMNQDIEYPAPEAVVRLRETIIKADGIWIFSPEYNRSYPGHIKNMLDWLSRPLKPNDNDSPSAIADKKFTLSGAGGNMATSLCREKLGELLTFIKADLMKESQTGIVLGMEAWMEGVMVLTNEQRNALRQQVNAFLAFIS